MVTPWGNLPQRPLHGHKATLRVTGCNHATDWFRVSKPGALSLYANVWCNPDADWFRVGKLWNLAYYANLRCNPAADWLSD